MDCKIVLISSLGVFGELCNGLVHSLNELGHTASIVIPQDPNEYESGKLNIIIKALRPAKLKSGINVLYQTEGLWNRRQKGVYDLSSGYNRVLELFEENCKIKIGTKNVVYCPIGWSPAFENGLPKVEEDIDIYFYGADTIRRKTILSNISNMGYNLIVDRNCYGRERDKKIMRSKITINMRAHEKWSYGPLHSLLAQCNKKMVLSEVSSDGYGPYIPNRHFIEWNDLNDLKEKADYWLNHNKEREEFAENVYNELKKDYTMTKYLKDGLRGII